MGLPALQGKPSSPLSDEVGFGLTWMLDRLVTAFSREVRARDSETLHLFIDGACEPSSDGTLEMVTSIGGVLLDGKGRGLEFFGLLPGVITFSMVRGLENESSF